MSRMYDDILLGDTAAAVANSTHDDFCGGSPIFDVQMTWNSTWPQFTECFQNTVLTLVPCGWIWITSILYLWCLVSSGRPEISLSKLNVAKCIFIALLAALSVADGVKAIVDHSNAGESSARDDVLSPFIRAATMVFVIILIQIQRKRGMITSAILLLFWVFEFLAGLVPFYSRIILQEYDDDLFSFVLYIFDYALVVILLVLHCLAEEPPPDPAVVGKPCPETQCSALSLVTYVWITPLIMLGYKRTLVEDDLYELNPSDKCQTVIPSFTGNWIKQIHKLACSRDGLILKSKRPKIPKELVSSKSQNGLSPGEVTEKTPLLTSAFSPKSGESARKDNKGTARRKSEIKLSFLKTIIQTFGWSYLFTHLCTLAWVCLGFVSPLILNLLINFTSDFNEPEWKGYLYACLIVLVSIAQSWILNSVFFWGIRLGMRIKASVIALVYRKALTMTPSSRKDSTVGEIVNLMSVDTGKLQELSIYIWAIWSCPVQMIFSLVFLYMKIGAAVFAGLAVIVLLIPVNYFVLRKMQVLQDEQMTTKDKRVKLISEILNGIKIIKFYAWEESFKEKVDAIRKEELILLRRGLLINAYNIFCWTLTPGLVALVSFMTYIFISEDHYLSPDKAFVSMSYLNILRFSVNLLPTAITDVARANVSLRRINHFLSNEDIDPENVHYDNNQVEAVTIKDGNFQWDENLGPCLKNINLAFPEGKLVAIVGQVGCGKSSLISAMLGDMEKLSGKVSIKGRIAYVPQEAWIQNATVRNNITFGTDLKSSKYNKLLDACALRPDLEILAAGDKTEIGEKGINLSGGQKQRVSLARAVYSDADIYLLDDPLSAVDAHVGKHIFEQVISDDGLLKSKTRILVTHGVQWLPKFDLIIVIVDGSVTEIGSYEELLANDGAFAQFLRTYLIEHKDETLNVDSDDADIQNVRGTMLKRLISIQTESAQSGDEDETVRHRGKAFSSSSGRERSDRHKQSGHQSNTSLSKRKAFSSSSGKELSGHHRKSAQQSSSARRKMSRTTSVIDDPQRELLGSFSASVEQQMKNEIKPSAALIGEEEAEVGSVKGTIYIAYLKAVTYWRGILTILCFALYQASIAGGSIWLQVWTDNEILSNTTISPDNPEKQDLNNMYLGIYGLFNGLQGFFILAFSIMMAFTMVKGARTLHDGMISNILRSPMSFFDTTPIGRIINRFSRDIDSCDEELPFNFINFFAPFFGMINTLVIISINLPIFLAVVAPLLIVYIIIQRFYVTTSRQLKRVDSKTRSPIFNHFSETLNGAAVIRAYGQQERFISTSDSRVDNNQVFFIYGQASNRWLGIVLDLLGNTLLFAAAMFAVSQRQSMSGGVMGLTISYAQQLTMSLTYAVRATSDIETNIVSVERILQYSNTPTEAPWNVPEFKPPSDWPQSGVIKFQNYMTRYRAGLNLVLKGIDADVKGGEKVGIVGRTGAGKSSLTLALFRIIESAGGRIEIDDRNIAAIGLHDLRKRLTILPQDPVLFSGSLRMNIDPFDDYSDEAIWKALEHAHLKTFVSGLPDELLYECGEGGQNLSVGQKQLLCLARSLLRKTKILILDEATAAVDMETDDLIQQTIREEFKDCTIVTIAHRLNTIMDYDRIMVLHDGLVKEFDSPSNLLQNTSSEFYGMAKNAGLVKAKAS